MRVLLLVHYYFPNTQSCAPLFHDLAVAMRERGNDVTIVSPEPSLDARRRVSREQGITVVRIRSGRFQGVSRAVRAWNEWRLSQVMWSGGSDWFRDNPCDLIVSMSPTIFFGPLVARLKQTWGSRNYLVLRDIFPEWAVQRRLIRRGGAIHRFFSRYELSLYDTADVIGVPAPSSLEYFNAPGLHGRHRVEVLPNWSATTGREVAATDFRRQLRLQGRVVFLYGGNLGVAQDTMGMVRLAESMQNDARAFFVIVGDGTEVQRLREEIRRRRLENLLLMEPVDFPTYQGMVSEFDVGMINLAAELKTHNYPHKMYDYMYFGKPILASLNPGNDLREHIERHEAGLVCWSDQDAALLDNARRLLQDDGLRERLGHNSRKLLEGVFSAGRAAEQILSHA